MFQVTFRIQSAVTFSDTASGKVYSMSIIEEKFDKGKGDADHKLGIAEDKRIYREHMKDIEKNKFENRLNRYCEDWISKVLDKKKSRADIRV